MLGNLSFCLSFIVLGIWLMKYDSIKRRFVKSSSKSRSLALVQSMECSLSKTCLVSADLSNRRCRMSAKCSFLRMEKVRFVSPMYEKLQSWHGIWYTAPCRILGSTESLWWASFLPMVLHDFNTVLTLWLDKQRRIFSVNPGYSCHYTILPRIDRKNTALFV